MDEIPEISVGGDTRPYSFWGALWDAALAQRGIMSRRMHESMLDMAAQDQAAAVEADGQISAQLQAAQESATTDTDLHQLEVMQSRQGMLRKLFGHSDPKVRAAAMTQMLGLNEQIGAYYEDLESRQEALADKDRDLRLARGDEYRKTITGAQDRIREINTKADTMYNMVNELGVDNDAVQAYFRDMIGYNAAQTDRGPGASLNLFGIIGGSVGNDLKPLNRDQIIKGTVAWQTGQTGQIGTLVQNTVAAAEKDGYRANVDDGAVNLEDLRITPTSEPRTARPALNSEDGKPSAPAIDGALNRLRSSSSGWQDRLARTVDGWVGNRHGRYAAPGEPQAPPTDANAARIQQKYRAMRRPVN